MQLKEFLQKLHVVSRNSLKPGSPLLVAEDVERILPNGLVALLDLLDGLQVAGIRFCSIDDILGQSSIQDVSYVPAGTMEGGYELWNSNVDDHWFRERLNRISTRMAGLFDPLAPPSEKERIWRKQLMKLHDSGFYFWPYISRTRRSFFDGLEALEASLNSEKSTDG